MAIDTIKSSAITDGTISTADIADGAINNAKVDTNAGIVTSKISGLNAAIDGGLGRLENEVGLLNVNRLVDNSAVVDDFVKGFSDAFEDETGVNTGANTNATYANTDKKYGLSAVVNSLGYEHQLDDAANWTAHDATRKAYYTFGAHGGNGMSMATTSYGGNTRSSIYVNSSSSLTNTELIRWKMADTTNNGGVGIYEGSSQSHIRLTGNASLAGGFSSNSNHWASGNPETGGLKGLFVQMGTNNMYVYNVRGQNSTTIAYVVGDVFAFHRATDGTVTFRKNGVDTGATVNSTGNFTGDWRVVVNHAGEGHTMDIEYLQLYKLTPTGTTNASTFQTQARTATSVPTTVRLVLLGKEEQTQTLNTDTVFQISRNNASNFSAITMTESGTYNSAGVKIYTGTLDVSSQPSGSQIVLKMTTTATKGFTLHGYSILYK